MDKVIDVLKSEDRFANSPKRKKLYPVIVQVGVGGTGSNLAQQLAQMLLMFEQDAYYCLADYDEIERKNINNQLFVENTIGKKKADILSQRYSTAYNIQVSSFTKNFVEDVSTLMSLFDFNYQEISGSSSEISVLPILIGCVDNNFTRKIFHQMFEQVPNILYIDSGNESAVVPKDFPQRPKEKWSKDEWEAYNESGWTGQVVCGLKLKNEILLEPVATRFPEILEDDDEIKRPSELSCEELSSSDPQRLQTNRMAALAIGTYLTELFECGTISNSMTVFHAKKGYMRSQSIK